MSTMPAAHPSLARWISRDTDGFETCAGRHRVRFVLGEAQFGPVDLRDRLIGDQARHFRRRRHPRHEDQVESRRQLAQPFAERMPPCRVGRRLVEIVDDEDRLRRKQSRRKRAGTVARTTAGPRRIRDRSAAARRAPSTWLASRRLPRASDSGRRCRDRHPRRRPGTRRPEPCAPRRSLRSASICPRPAARRSTRSGCSRATSSRANSRSRRSTSYRRGRLNLASVIGGDWNADFGTGTFLGFKIVAPSGMQLAIQAAVSVQS